jgi:ABC-type polar amino acid transport system ATPase subunit
MSHPEITGVGIRPQKSALSSTTSGGRSVGIVRSRAKALELLLVTVTTGVLDPDISANHSCI